MQASDSRGKPKAGAPEHAGSAEVVSSGPLFDEVTRKIQAKHPVMRHITKVLAKLGGIVKRKRQPYADRAVIVRLDAAG